VDLAGSEAKYIGREPIQTKEVSKGKKSLLNTPSPVKKKNVNRNGRTMWGVNKILSPKSNIESERNLVTPSDSSDRFSTMMLGSPTNNKKSTNSKKTTGKEITHDVETEAKFINKNLTTLGRVFQILSNRKIQGKVPVPPYRECKLTRLLQTSLQYGEECRTLMIVTVCQTL
jgi:hypothetical protein